MTPPPARVLVAVAWPYANGPLHLGHVAGSLLPPDVFARYQRMRGREVAMVSGSDMHGTPITVAAEKEGVTPEALAARYNALHKDALAALRIRFDLFTSTATRNHREVVHEMFRTLLANGLIDKRAMIAPYDPKAKRFLPDRYVEGECPHCHFAEARGDQCDNCGRTLDPQELLNPRSKLTGTKPEYRETEHFFLRLDLLQDELSAWVSAQKTRANWRPGVVNFTEQWLREGLKPRPITRDLTYGVPIPSDVGDYAEKCIYVWFEAVVGYLSATIEWAKEVKGDPEAWKPFWHDPATRAYYFLGKDNIPFHTIIWPGMLLGYDRAPGALGRLNTPWDVPANEFLQLKGAKFSKSRGNAFYILDLLQIFSPDQVRYYLAVNMPERGDTDWTWEDFVAKVNDELVGTLGNYANRVLAFCEKNYGGLPPATHGALSPAERAALDEQFLAPATAAFAEAASHLDACEFKKALRTLVNVSAMGNRAVDAHAPWTLVKQGEAGKAKAGEYLRAHLRVIRALSAALAPFLPDAASALTEQLGDAAAGADPRGASERALPGVDHWPLALGELPPTGKLGKVAPVFGKLDLKAVLEEFQPQEEKKPMSQLPAPTPGAPAVHAESKPAAAAPAEGKAEITIDDFAKVDLRVGLVKSVEDHPKADKLYVLQVDLGTETRQVVAGLKAYVPKEELLGRKVVLVANLAPAKLRGVESQGMILAADHEGIVTPLAPLKDVPPGAKIR